MIADPPRTWRSCPASNGGPGGPGNRERPTDSRFESDRRGHRPGVFRAPHLSAEWTRPPSSSPNNYSAGNFRSGDEVRVARRDPAAARAANMAIAPPRRLRRRPSRGRGYSGSATGSRLTCGDGRPSRGRGDSGGTRKAAGTGGGRFHGIGSRCRMPRLERPPEGKRA